MCTSTITKSAMASGRLMSPVGAASHSKWLPRPTDLEEVADEDEDEQRHRQRDDRLAGRADRALDLLGDRLDAHLEGDLELPGPGRATWRRRAIVSRTTTTSAAPVAHMVSTLTVSPNSLRVTCSPTEMSAASKRRGSDTIIGPRPPLGRLGRRPGPGRGRDVVRVRQPTTCRRSPKSDPPPNAAGRDARSSASSGRR